MIQILILKHIDLVLIGKVIDVLSDLGEPDCKLIDPYIIDKNGDLGERYAVNYTNDRYCLIRSDDIFTILNPLNRILDEYCGSSGQSRDDIDEDDNEDNNETDTSSESQQEEMFL
jgi:hypothetical protein